MPRVKISLIFESGARIGPGKARLLESIRDTGSISAAARDMRMSYKRAWVLLDSMNQAFTETLIAASPGGAGGARNRPQRFELLTCRAAAASVQMRYVLADITQPGGGS
jgi:molybdate transport repressor ModE-like protein